MSDTRREIEKLRTILDKLCESSMLGGPDEGLRSGLKDALVCHQEESSTCAQTVKEFESRLVGAWKLAVLNKHAEALELVDGLLRFSESLPDDLYISAAELKTRLLIILGFYEEVLPIEEEYAARFQGVLLKSALNLHLNIGAAYLRLSKYSEAMERNEEIIQFARYFDDQGIMAKASHNLGIVYKNVGNLDLASKYAQIGVRYGRERKLVGLPRWLLTTGIILYWRGEFHQSVSILKESQKLSKKYGYKRGVAGTSIALGYALLSMGDYKNCSKYLCAGLDASEEFGEPRFVAIAHEFLGDLDRAEGRSEEAGKHYAEAMKIALRIAPRGDMVTEIGRRLADWRLDRGEVREARVELERTLEIAQEIGDRREEGILHRVRARMILASRGRLQSAETALKKSIDILEEIGTRYEEALSRIERGRLRVSAPRRSREDRRCGLEDFQRAAAIFEDLGLPKKKSELLIETVRVAGGVLSPYEGLSLLQEADVICGRRRDHESLGAIADLRSRLEEEAARIALDRESSFLYRKEGRGDQAEAVARISRRYDARHAFLLIEESPGGRRAVGAGEEEAVRLAARLGGAGERNLIVSSGQLTGSGEGSHGPFLAFRRPEAGRALLYVERELGGRPFDERETGEFVAYAERLFRDLPKRAPEGESPYPTVIARSGAMQRVVDRLVSVRNSRAPVLIYGETGTGKGLLAKLLHQLGDRADTSKFVQIHCAELPETLLESELFGHVRGAFTGAVTEKVGLFETADGGTLFLDEVGDLTPEVQVRLLRVIEEGRLKRVGEASDRAVDVRVVTATHRDLCEEVAAGRFREDLYYRLHVIRLTVPPLRERREDISPMVSHFIARYASEEKKNVAGVDKAAMERFRIYAWPGNVRELQNEIRRIVALHPNGEPITEEELSAFLRGGRATRHFRAPEQGFLLRELATFEERRIQEALADTGGSLRECARALGISAQLLRYKLKKYNIKIRKT